MPGSASASGLCADSDALGQASCIQKHNQGRAGSVWAGLAQATGEPLPQAPPARRPGVGLGSCRASAADGGEGGGGGGGGAGAAARVGAASVDAGAPARGGGRAVCARQRGDAAEVVVVPLPLRGAGFECGVAATVKNGTEA